VMCETFIKGAADPNGPYDLHRLTAAKMFGVQYASVTADQRNLAKNINFGVLYGISAYGLVDQMRQRGLTDYDEQACEKMRLEWRRIYKRGWEFIGEVERFVAEHGYARDWSGHYRYLAGVWSPDAKTAAEAKRQGVNLIIQGGAGAYMKCAMAWMWPQVQQWKAAGEFVDLALMVYDSLVFWCDEQHADKVEALTIEALTQHGGLKLRVPVDVGTGRATSWGQL
jgi:DNA polymerase I